MGPTAAEGSAGGKGPPRPARPYRRAAPPLSIPPHRTGSPPLSFRLLVVCLLAAAPAALHAQDSIPPAPRDSATPPIGGPPLGRDSAFGPVGVVVDTGPRIIRKIRIVRDDVFDGADAHKWYGKIGNGLHIMTHEGIIAQEVLFKVGEPYDSVKAAEMARNLRARGLFRKVEVDTVPTDSGVVLRVITKDGWSTQADVRFRSAGSQTDWQLALIERNLLGTGTRFATKYRHTPDRNSLNFQFLQPRLLAKTVSLGVRYETRSDGDRGQVAVERPFFSLSDRNGITTLFDARNERVLQFRDGVGDPSDSLRRRFALGRVEAAHAVYASPKGYLRVGLTAQVRRDDYNAWPSNTISRDITGTVGPFLEWRRANFAVTSGFARVGQDEDVDLSTFARIQLMAAPEAFGYRKDGLGGLAQVRLGTQLARGGFMWLDGRVNGVVTSAGLDSGSVVLGSTVVLKPARGQLAIGHADIGWIKNPLPGTEFDLGFAVGPRGFPIHAFTGDRTYFSTAEYRVILANEVLKTLAIGVAGFVDHGGAWYAGAKRRTGTNLGLGIRLGPSRVADANQTRLDLAYRFKNDQEKAGWVFVIASGLTFNTTPRGL